MTVFNLDIEHKFMVADKLQTRSLLEDSVESAVGTMELA